MKASIKTKSILASLLHRGGIHSWKLGRYSRDAVAILMYHRVIPKNEMGPSVQAGMVVEPDTLDLHLRYLLGHFEIVPLSELVTRGCHSVRERWAKPLCALTFDDGWVDFREYAYPILRRHNVPATVFLPTDFIGTRQWFWTDRVGLLLDRLARAPNGAMRVLPAGDHLLKDLVNVQGTHETRLEWAIARLKHYPLERIEQVLSELAEALGEDPAPADRAFLSWDEARDISGSGLVSFGSHTAGHLLLTTLTEEQAWHELTKSRDALIASGVADQKFLSFSYPNGNFSERLSELVREAGYHLAVTTQCGWHYWTENPLAVKRIPVHQDIAFTEAMLASRIVSCP